MSRSDKSAALADAPAVVASLGILALFAYTVAGRLLFPYDLEWMEGGMMVHAWRVLEGLPLYVEPSPDFVPFIYPPLYHWAVAGLGAVFGLDYPVARGLSVAGTLVAAVLAGVAARREGASWSLAVVAAGLYLSTYEDSGAFFDLARIDGLFMALTTGALVAGREKWWRTAGLLLTLAYATKHSAAIFGLPIVLWAWRWHGLAAARTFALWSVVPAVLFTGAVMLEGDGLFLTYLLGVPGAHPMHGERLAWLTHKELFLALPLTTVAAVVWPVVWKRGGGRFSEGSVYWTAMVVLAWWLSALMRAHHGGFTNVLMPGAWGLSLAGVLALHHLRARVPHWGVVAATSVLIAGQLYKESWDPDRLMADADDWAAGDALVEVLREEPGPVLSPWAPWTAMKAGHPASFHLIGVWDLEHKRGPFWDDLDVFRDAFAEHRWPAVLVMNEKQVPPGLKKHYRRRQAVLPAGPRLTAKTGWRVRPKNFWRPKGDHDP